MHATAMPDTSGSLSVLSPPSRCLAKPFSPRTLSHRQQADAVVVVQGLRARFQLPIGAIVHPMADPQDVPVVSLDSPGIVRCRRCRTYINPFVTWQDGGR